MISKTKDVSEFKDNNVAVLKEILDKLHRLSLNSQGDRMTGRLQLKGETPASATATGKSGTVTWDASYIYVCVADNTWKRVGISTW